MFMSKYQGPSLFNGERPISFDPVQKKRDKMIQSKETAKRYSETKDGDPFKHKHAQNLPEQVMQRQEVEKEFRQYLKEKKKAKHIQAAKRSNHYVAPPFEASRVPSPIFGYHNPVRQQKKEWDYEELKSQLQKEEYEFMLFEGYETQELTELWTMLIEDETILEKQEKEKNSLPLQQSKKLPKRTRLSRSLSGIIEEAQSGIDLGKSNIPVLFPIEKDTDQS